MRNFEEHVEMNDAEDLAAFYDYQGEREEDRQIIAKAENEDKGSKT